MNGAESLLRTLAAHDVAVCFANPGTSEMHLVQAIDATGVMRSVLCLFEGVCTGAADGYARMAGRPAMTLLHLGAGLGNGIANLHNCRRGGAPLINVVGDHAIHHVAYDAPLTADIEAVAKPVSAWIRTARTPEGLGLDAVDAVRAARSPNPQPKGGIATLIVPADCAWGAGRPRDRDPAFEDSIRPPRVGSDVIESLVPQLDEDTLILIDGDGLTEDGIRQAGRIAAARGSRLGSTTFPARAEAGPDLPLVHRLPYFPEQVTDALKSVKRLVLAGAQRPVSFFAYQGLPSDLVPEDCEVVRLAHRHEDVAQALTDVADALDAPAMPGPKGARPEIPPGRLSRGNVAAILSARAPEGSIMASDSGGGGAAFPLMQRSVRHTWLNLTGGSIGDGGPVAAGAAVACPERQVFALVGDGGAMYTLQYLWTAARENLNIVTVIYSNRQYNILEVEYRRMGVNDIGAAAASMFDLSNPEIDWVGLAAAQGVPGSRAADCEEFDAALGRALAEDGPYLIEAVL
ncbi:MAG: acetolactate synthase large subunit [Gammaproteobacteria bacterium]|nr:acetolactate synthase large subunit [Gammaproteobacteria bacterium]